MVAKTFIALTGNNPNEKESILPADVFKDYRNKLLKQFANYVMVRVPLANVCLVFGDAI